ncbi:hypothetical protein JCM11251_007814 [Rhodosporidiobolus azoricus]
MSYSYQQQQYYNQYSSQALPDLQSIFSLLSSVVLISLIILFLSSSYLGLDFLTAPVDSLNALTEMASLGISSLLGKSGMGKVDWSGVGVGGAGEEAVDDAGGLGAAAAAANGSAGGKGKVVRRYRETRDGASRVEGGGQYYPGLLNAAGNLCFLNATLQSMASLPPLLTYLDSLVTSALELSSPAPVSTTLLDTLEALNTPSTSRPPPLRPVELAVALADSSPSRRRLLASSEQQDAHELWGMIRDAVEEEANKLVQVQERKRQAGAGLAEVAKLRDGLGIALSRKKVVRGRNDPWFFLKSQRIRCMECGYVRDTRHEGEELLMLNVPAVAHCSLHDLLADYTKTDLLSEYNCRKCGMIAILQKLKQQRDRLAGIASEVPFSPAALPAPTSSAKPNPFELPPETPVNGKGDSGKMTSSRKDRRRKIQKVLDRVQAVVDAEDYEKEFGEDVKVANPRTAAGKLIRFARTPELLMIHLNRSSAYGYHGPIKNTCAVTFPEYLDISPFCDGASPPSSSSSSFDSASPPSPTRRDIYRLDSLVVHYGSHSFGHYVAFRRRPSTSTDNHGSSNLPDWYRISDETVDPSSITEALRSNPFLLFYERVRDDQGEVASAAAAGLANLDAFVNGAQARVVESWRLARGDSAKKDRNGKEDTERVEARAVPVDEPPA